MITVAPTALRSYQQNPVNLDAKSAVSQLPPALCIAIMGEKLGGTIHSSTPG